MRHPEQPEQIISGDASVDHYVAPENGIDSALIVEFKFRLGWRTNSVVLTFIGDDSVRVDRLRPMQCLQLVACLTRDAALQWLKSTRSRP